MHGSILEVRNISPWEYSRVSARFRCGGSVSSVQVRRFLLALDYVFPRSATGNFAKLHLYFRAMRERYRSRNCARSFRENREAVPALLPLALPGCRGILISGQA